jgi:hypothetical protein
MQECQTVKEVTWSYFPAPFRSIARTAETTVTNVVERLLKMSLLIEQTEVTKRSVFISEKTTPVAFISL